MRFIAIVVACLTLVMAGTQQSIAGEGCKAASVVVTLASAETHSATHNSIPFTGQSWKGVQTGLYFYHMCKCDPYQIATCYYSQGWTVNPALQGRDFSHVGCGFVGDPGPGTCQLIDLLCDFRHWDEGGPPDGGGTGP